jgi:hypothetical protein
MSAWQPISTAPKDRALLLWDPRTRSVNVGVYNDSYTEKWHALVLGGEAHWSDDSGPNPIFTASHWMPLPSAPHPPAPDEEV